MYTRNTTIFYKYFFYLFYTNSTGNNTNVMFPIGSYIREGSQVGARIEV